MEEILFNRLDLYLKTKQALKSNKAQKEFKPLERLCSFNMLSPTCDLENKDRYADLNKYLKEKEEDFITILYKKIDESGLKDSEVYNKAGIDRRLFSKIKHADYKPDRDTVLALCIALELEIDEIEDMLKKTCHSLSKSRTKDLIIRFFIEELHNYNFFDINEALITYSCKPINKF